VDVCYLSISLVLILNWSFQNGRLFILEAVGFFASGSLANAYELIVFGGGLDHPNISPSFYQNLYSFNLADVYIFVALMMILFVPTHKEEPLNQNSNA
jgi:lipoprotein signal peptidase